jgi:hypothetical protein
MTSCAYCGEQATDEIPAIPGRVCREHAQEFWTGLLSYVKGQSAPTATHETPCVCGVCNDMSMVKLRMIAAGAEAGPSPENAERAPIAEPRDAITHGRQGAGFDAAARETPRRADNVARA